jgi:hypothetical protein
VRLLSPEQVIQAYKHRPGGTQSPTVTLDTEGFTFHDPNDHSNIMVPFHERSNPPISPTSNGATLISRTIEVNLFITDEMIQNLSELQTELLRWHFQLGRN